MKGHSLGTQSGPTRLEGRRRSTGLLLRGDKADRLRPVVALFARFRREHPPGTRVPEALRVATLSALDAGVAPRLLYRSCGVSSGQVAVWRANASQAAGHPVAQGRRKVTARAPQSGSSGEEVRVFNIVGTAGSVAVEPELEFRLGAWSVRIRLAANGGGAVR